MKIEFTIPEAESLTAALLLLAEQVEGLKCQIAQMSQATTKTTPDRVTRKKEARKTENKAEAFCSRDIASFLAGVITPGTRTAEETVEDQVETTVENNPQEKTEPVKLGPIPFHFDGQWDKEARLARFKCPDSELRGQTGYLCKKNYSNGCGSKTRCFGCNDMFKKSGVIPSDRLLNKLKREHIRKMKAMEGK